MPKKRSKPPMPQMRRKSTFVPGGPLRGAAAASHARRQEAENAVVPVVTDESGAFTATALQRVTKLASLDKSEATIANAVGLTAKAFAQALRVNEALAKAYEIGNGLARDFYVDRLRKHGKKFFISDIFAAKALHSLSDAPAPDRGSERSPVTIVFNDAKSVEDWARHRPASAIDFENRHRPQPQVIDARPSDPEPLSTPTAFRDPPATPPPPKAAEPERYSPGDAGKFYPSGSRKEHMADRNAHQKINDSFAAISRTTKRR